NSADLAGTLLSPHALARGPSTPFPSFATASRRAPCPRPSSSTPPPAAPTRRPPPTPPPMRRLSTPAIRKRKVNGVTAEPIVMLTAYTARQAQLLDAHCDLLLVGDSLGQVIYGLPSSV